MPAERLREIREVSRFSLIGSDSAAGEALVQHVGLAARTGPVDPKSACEVYESGPPLSAGGHTGTGDMKSPTVIGWLDDLDDDEIADIELWLEEVRPLARKSAIANYVALPEAIDDHDPVNGRRTSVRFSCAGFVYRCYAEGAGVRLIELAALPLVDLSTILKAWPTADREDRRRLIGLTGNGPWPVLLPGYLFHGLVRANPREPYIPSAKDAEFG